MRLFLAEKKSLGEAVASALGNAVPGQGCITCGNDVVTWCAGHILEMLMPEEYDPALEQWSFDSLPIIPTVWKNKPKESAGRQLGTIKGLLPQATSVVNCGDPDREGQLLVDEVLEHFGYSGPVQRIWLDDGLTPAAIQRAMGKMGDNREKFPLRDAARARSRADWLVGLNATRAMTLMGRSAGRRGVLPVGRVQTPTLCLVVMRDMAIENFKPHPFYVLKAHVTHPAGNFWATFKPSENAPGLDVEGRLADESQAAAIGKAAKGASGSIIFASTEEKKRQPPLAYSLSALSKAASSRYGMTAKEVLEAAQALYLAKLTSYPRTNCRYLPEDQRDEGAAILAGLGGFSGPLASVAKAARSADPTLHSPAWNSARLTAHHGIIPTGVLPPDGMPEKQQHIFELICTNYALQFHPPMRYEAREIHVALGDTVWQARGQRTLETGWTAFSAAQDDVDGSEKEVGDVALPPVAQGDTVSCQDVENSKKMTSPPARFTDGTLLEAMENVHRFVADATGKEKEILRQTKGIGTDATRATIIDGLIQRGFMSLHGKQIVSTPLGRQLIDLVPSELKNPLTTAEWEEKLEQIADGNLGMDAFLVEICTELPKHIDAIKNLKIERMADAFPCPECQKAMQRFKGKDGKFYWGCFEKEAHESKEGIFMDDKDGKPVPRVQFPCPVCKNPLQRFKGKDGKIRWGCFESGAHTDQKPVFLDDKGGKPVVPRDYPCPECGKPMRRCPSKKEPGAFYWACFESEAHKGKKPFFAGDKNGKPDLGGKK